MFEIAGQKTDSIVSGLARKRSVESIETECLTGRKKRSQLASSTAAHSSMATPSLATRVINASTRFINVSKRCLQLVRPVCALAYYRDAAAFERLLRQGGVFGKTAQFMSADLHTVSKLFNEDEDENAVSFTNAVLNSLSQFKEGEVHPNDIIRGLQANLATDIEHICTLGRGTIAQVDHVRINSQDYAVKIISPVLANAIKADIDLITKLFSPGLYWTGIFSLTNMYLFIDFCKEFRAETDLNRELINTKLQAKIFKTLVTGTSCLLLRRPG